MNKQLILLLPILLLSCCSAIYCGESMVTNNTLNSDNLLYTIIDNTSYLIYPIIEVNLTNIKITIPDNSNPNSYQIVFVNNESKTQTIVVSSKGHSKTKIVNQTIEKIIEVPNYIENKTIEIVNQTITKTEFKEVKEPTKWTFILSSVIILIVFVLLWYFIKRLNKKYTDKLDSLENKEENGEENE